MPRGNDCGKRNLMGNCVLPYYGQRKKPVRAIQYILK